MDEEEPMDISGDSFSANSPRKLHQKTDYSSESYMRRRSIQAKFKSKSLSLDREAARTPKRLSLSAIPSLVRKDSSRKDYTQEDNKRRPRHSMSDYDSPSRHLQHSTAAIHAIRHLSEKFEKQNTSKQHTHHRNKQEAEENDEIKNVHLNKKRSQPFITISQKVYFLIFLILLFFIIHVVRLSGPGFGSTCKLTVDISKLKSNLNKNLFGQHLASDLVLSMSRNLSRHFQRSLNNSQTVLSFHGWSGVGKNHMANILMRAFNPVKVQTFLIPSHFPHSSQDEEYRQLIPEWVTGNITKCAMNVFVFDEMDKASEAVIKGIRGAIEEVKNINQTKKIWTLFILLSNSKGSEINNYLFSQLKNGRVRESLTHEEFIPTLLDGSEKSWYGPLYKDSIITHMIPYLPLAEDHVLHCIKRDLYLKNRVPNMDTIDRILKELPFYQPFDESDYFSTTGCKRVSSKVDLHLDD